MLNFKLVTEKEHDLAFSVYRRIFDWILLEDDPYIYLITDDKDIKDGAKKLKIHDYLVYDGDTIVGISGLYCYPDVPDSAWLRWFGVLPEQRRNHYGSKILKAHEEEISKQGYKFSRLYTETNNNEATRSFYEKNGYIGEDYDCPEDYLVPKGMLTIYSKAVGDKPLTPWNNINMQISEYTNIPEGMTVEEYIAKTTKNT